MSGTRQTVAGQTLAGRAAMAAGETQVMARLAVTTLADTTAQMRRSQPALAGGALQPDQVERYGIWTHLADVALETVMDDPAALELARSEGVSPGDLRAEIDAARAALQGPDGLLTRAGLDPALDRDAMEMHLLRQVEAELPRAPEVSDRSTSASALHALAAEANLRQAEAGLAYDPGSRERASAVEGAAQTLAAAAGNVQLERDPPMPGHDPAAQEREAAADIGLAAEDALERGHDSGLAL
jgi:hypothetical protein